MSPIYSYQCLLCNTEFDSLEKIGANNQDKPCSDPKCQGTAIRIIAARGSVLSDTPAWLDDHVQGALLDTDSRNFRPIETRSQLKKHLKDKGICDSPGSGPRWI
jgi:putative FmdB family regulatory protein